MTYGEIIDRERPRNIKDTISKDEKETRSSLVAIKVVPQTRTVKKVKI